MSGRAPRAGLHHPGSTGEFQSWFATDADCLDYLEWLRSPLPDPSDSGMGGSSLVAELHLGVLLNPLNERAQNLKASVPQETGARVWQVLTPLPRRVGGGLPPHPNLSKDPHQVIEPRPAGGVGCAGAAPLGPARNSGGGSTGLSERSAGCSHGERSTIVVTLASPPRNPRRCTRGSGGTACALHLPGRPLR